MEATNHKQEILLAAIGLKAVMVEKNDTDAFNKDLFHRYTPQDYLHSERKDMDEVYRMEEIVLIHKSSGLRLEYLTTESYFGDEYRYRIRDIFILTKALKRIAVTDIDFTREMFVTPEGVIPFSEVRMDSGGD